MTAADPIRTLIERLSPQAICEACLAGRLAFADRQQVGFRMRELAGSDGFELQQGRCSICGEARKVVRRVRR